jgi:NADH-quinone oxidoreductase subunit N
MYQLATYFVYLLLLSVAGFIVSGFGSIFTKNRKTQFIVSNFLLIMAAVSAVVLLITNYDATVFNIVHLYAFSSLFVMLFSITMLLVNLLSYMRSKDYTNLTLFLSLSYVGMFIVATSLSLLTLFIGLELLAVSTSFMILFEGKNRIEAAVKFFILSSVSIAILGFAIAMLLPYDTGLTLTAAAQSPNIGGTVLLVLSMALFIAAFGFDMALFPFNLWVPDVYEGSPTYITAMLAGVNKKVAFVALIEVFFFVFLAYSSTFSIIFVVLSILTMFFGNLIALTQENIKRMFAYSSISQAGYILIGIASVTQFGLEASIFYIIAHSFMIIGTFAIIMWLESKNIKTLSDYTGLDSRNRFAAASLTVFMLSMAGIPLLIGFDGKLLLFLSAIGHNLLLLTILGIANSFISMYYYAKLMSAMYTRRDEKKLSIDPYIAVVVIIALAVVIGFGIYPQPLINLASMASRAVIGI